MGADHWDPDVAQFIFQWLPQLSLDTGLLPRSNALQKDHPQYKDLPLGVHTHFIAIGFCRPFQHYFFLCRQAESLWQKPILCRGEWGAGPYRTDRHRYLYFSDATI